MVNIDKNGYCIIKKEEDSYSLTVNTVLQLIGSSKYANELIEKYIMQEFIGTSIKKQFNNRSCEVH